MPICSGIVASRILRQLGINVTIVAVTGNALEEDEREFRAAGIQEFFTKPVDRKRLSQTLTTYSMKTK